MNNCLFCKIIKGEIPSKKVYEDKNNLVFLDISPINKGHLLIVPKNHSTDFLEMNDLEITTLFGVAQKMGRLLIEKLNADGFNIIMNTKPASGQIIFHSHLHIIPRFEGDGFKHWQGKSYENDEDKKILEKLIN